MPYKNEAKTYVKTSEEKHKTLPYDNKLVSFNMPKGQVDTTTGNILEICSFYNNYPRKIKASNIFPEMAQGSSTGKYTIIVFYDK